MLQELKLTTTFHVATPSALWRHQVAGLTSPAWVRAPAALRLTRRGWKENPRWRMVDFGSFVGCTARAAAPAVPDPGHPPSTVHLILLLRCPRILLPKLWTTEDSVRNITRKKSSASYDEKEKKKIQTLLIWALLTALLCFYTIHSLCHVFFQC